MRYDFIEAFSDIEDEYIADAMPMAQKPVELRPEPRSRRYAWRKLAAAAACLAVLSAGGVFAVNSLRSGVVTPSDSDLPSDSGVSLNSLGSSNSGSNSFDLLNGVIEYEGSAYLVVNSASYDGVKLSVGFRQLEYGRGSYILGLIAVENTTDKPVALAQDNDSGVKVDIKGLVDKCRASSDMDSPYIIQPGETYYQPLDFDTCTKEYTEYSDRWGNYKTTQLVAAGSYNGTAALKLLSDSGEVIEHTLDFAIDIGDWNTADHVGGYVKAADVDDHLKQFGPEIFTIRDDIPGMEFECDYRSISVLHHDGSKTKLFGGEYLSNYCVCDLNNNGYGDIVATVFFEVEGGNASRSCVFVYDYVNGQLYSIADLDNYDIGEYVKSDAGTSGMGGRVMLVTNDKDGTRVSEKPLTFDMLTPCILDKNGEPAFIAIDPDGKTIGEVPMAPIGSYLTDKWNLGTEFVYEGKSYKVISHSNGGGMDIVDGKYTPRNWHDFVVGVRREIADGVDTVEFVAFIENSGSEPLGLMSSTASPDKPILFRFELNDGSIDTHNVFDYNEFKYMTGVLQPGETYYQKVSFPVTEEEYMFSTCFSLTDPDRFDENKSYDYNGTGGGSSNRWADFSDKSVDFDHVNELFGASNLSKMLQAAAEAAADK